MKGNKKAIKFWKKQLFYKWRGNKKQLNFGKSKK